jgi:hypothetical protein
LGGITGMPSDGADATPIIVVAVTAPAGTLTDAPDETSTRPPLGPTGTVFELVTNGSSTCERHADNAPSETTIDHDQTFDVDLMPLLLQKVL